MQCQIMLVATLGSFLGVDASLGNGIFFLGFDGTEEISLDESAMSEFGTIFFFCFRDSL